MCGSCIKGIISHRNLLWDHFPRNIEWGNDERGRNEIIDIPIAEFPAFSST